MRDTQIDITMLDSVGINTQKGVGCLHIVMTEPPFMTMKGSTTDISINTVSISKTYSTDTIDIIPTETELEVVASLIIDTTCHSMPNFMVLADSTIADDESLGTISL